MLPNKIFKIPTSRFYNFERTGCDLKLIRERYLNACCYMRTHFFIQHVTSSEFRENFIMIYNAVSALEEAVDSILAGFPDERERVW